MFYLQCDYWKTPSFCFLFFITIIPVVTDSLYPLISVLEDHGDVPWCELSVVLSTEANLTT